MREKNYMIEILNLDTGVTIRYKYNQAVLTYDQLLQILEMYNPEIDFETLVVYYYTRSKWIILLGSIKFQQHELQWQNNDSDEILLRIKYNCFLLLDEDEEKRFNQDVILMSEKINDVQDLYQDLKEKYKQQALDISIFWGSPLFATDNLKRNKRVTYEQNSKGQQLQLLTNQVKYAPYINAITTALQTCDKKKVHLEIDHLNDKSFSQRNVFTVVYLMAHLEFEEYRDKSKAKNLSKSLKERQWRRQEIKTEKKKPKTTYVEKKKTPQVPGLKKIQSEPLPSEFSSPSLQKQASVGGSVQFEIIIQETKDNESIRQENSLLLQQAQSLQASQQFKPQWNTQSVIVQSKITNEPSSQQPIESQMQKIDEQDDQDGETKDVYYDKDRKKGYTYYFLGEDINGNLCKISPKKLRSIIIKNTSRKIQLLILHSSYPNYHLDQLRDLANNIILINSNPLVPEPSSIYFIKQLFIHLLNSGNIEKAYDFSINDLNKLKEVNMNSKHNPSALKQLDQKDLQFMNNMNEKYVHGTFQCCCCYHPHHDKCHHKMQKSPSKYAEYHYKYHAKQCECQQNLMIHKCQQKLFVMQEHYGILDKNYQTGKQYYYCCCLGHDLGFYQHQKYNQRCDPIDFALGQKDPHSIKFKYKHQKAMINVEDNILQISQGKVTGDWSDEFIAAFKYIEDNPLLGNAPLIIKLFQIFTQQLKNCTIDIVRRANRSDIFMLCNIYGSKSTGRTTIATYFANLMIIKKLCKRIIIKEINSFRAISGIIKSTQNESQGRPFYIFIYQDKNSRPMEKSQQMLSQDYLEYPVSAIIISQQPIIIITTKKKIKMEYMKPRPFDNDNCQHYVKKYKHLSFEAKNNVRTLFHYGIRGYEEKEKIEIYPFSLNQFQILNLVKKTNFYDHKPFTLGLDRMKDTYIEYYIIIMYMIKFTNSLKEQKEDNLNSIKHQLQHLKSQKALFFYKFDDSLERNSRQQSYRSLSPEDIRNAYNSLASLDQIKDNFYLIFTSIGYKIKKKISKILQLFINYTTLIPGQKFNQDTKIKRDANWIRIKNSPFFKQVYEATAINQYSYINRYFSEELEEIYRLYCRNQVQRTQGLYDLMDFESFLKFHAHQLQPKKNVSKRLYSQSPSRPKEKRSYEHNASLDMHRTISHQQSNEDLEENGDIPFIYHLASVIEGGLQFIRNIVCTHFVYNRLSEVQKVDLLKYSMLLINNCIILLKNKKFYDISGKYDLDDTCEEKKQSTITQRFYQATHYLDIPELQTFRSQDVEMIAPPHNTRTYSGRDVLNPTRQFQGMKSVNMNFEDESRPLSTDQFLLKQLYRLSTYKGLLFLLDEIAKRLEECQSETNPNVVRIKIAVQLLSIQIRLEQLQIDKQSTQIVLLPNTNDRHLLRITQIFNEKNYNINILFNILKEGVRVERFQRDIEQLGLIKSHVIVSLALMASRYGRYKLAKDMTDDIKRFIEIWNGGVPLQRRQSQLRQNRDSIEQSKQLSFQYEFLKLICQNQYVYIFIRDAFTSTKFWVKQQRKNDEIVIYQDLVALYHHFTLKNTKTKGDYYSKLQGIIEKLHYFKRNKDYAPFSTYIHNFVENFIKSVQDKFKKLKSHLIAIFNAEDDKNYVKTSLNQVLETILKKENNQKQLFSIKRKFNQQTLKDLSDHCGCRYLCLFTSIGEKNQKQEILIETSEGRSTIIQKQTIVEAISSISTSVIFVCLPRKKMLAQSIIRVVKSKRQIVYFQFQINSFEFFKNSSEEYPRTDYIIIFEKMIMIETIRELIEGIIIKENQGSQRGLADAFVNTRNSLSFVFKNFEGKKIMALSNKQFRKCLYIDGQNNFKQTQGLEKIIEVYDSEKVNESQIQCLEKIVRKMIVRKQRFFNEKELFKLDSFQNIYHFIQVFSFYFRDKYGFSNIFNINLEIWRQHVKSNAIIKKFLGKLTDQNILDYIFSNKKVVIILYVQPENYNVFSNALQECDEELKAIISVIDQSVGKRSVSKFIGYPNESKKKITHAIVYILQPESTYSGKM